MADSKHRDTLGETRIIDSSSPTKPVIVRGISEKSLPWDQPHERTKTLDLNRPMSEHFKFLATIGKGAYGSVYLVENNLCPEESFAIKQIKESKYLDG